MEPVRSALLAVQGVTRARVTLENHEALVVFDPAQATVQDLIDAVSKAEGVARPNQYSAKVKDS
jgi:copper chaperone CopZ